MLMCEVEQGIKPLSSSEQQAKLSAQQTQMAAKTV